MKSQPILHLIEPHERAMVEEDDESYPPHVQVIVYTAVLAICLVSWGLVIWRLL